MRPLIVICCLLAPLAQAGVDAARLERGLQPRVVVAAGVIHMIYCQGEASGGDVFYRRRQTAPGATPCGSTASRAAPSGSAPSAGHA